MIKNQLIFLLTVLLLFAACSDDDDTLEAQFVGHQYLPLTVGAEHVYQVDSIRYDEFTKRSDTLRFQQRELIKSSFIDGENREAYLIQVFQREDESTAWNLVKTISKTRTTIRYERFEDNIKIIPLVFPISEGKDWNANGLSILNEANFRYKSVNLPLSIDGNTYDSTLTVIQEDEENLIERKFAEEKYAVNVGLIHRKDIDIVTDLEGKILRGYDATIRLISYKDN